MDPGDQLAGREGFGHVVVGTELQPQDPVHLVVPGREHEDRDGRHPREGRPQPTAHVEPVERPGQSHVQHHQHGTFPVDQGQPGFAGVGLQHPEAVTPEVQGHQVRDVVVVLDHHQGVLIGAHGPQPATRRAPGGAPVREV
jgi:hypothetical protein